MSEQAPKRRWFRFSLATMFVVMTMFGCWLGYHLKWMKDRTTVRKWIVTQTQLETPSSIVETIQEQPSGRMPLSLIVLGEYQYPFIFIGRSGEGQEKTDRMAARIRALFPEAPVHVGHAVWSDYSPLPGYP